MGCQHEDKGKTKSFLPSLLRRLFSWFLMVTVGLVLSSLLFTVLIGGIVGLFMNEDRAVAPNSVAVIEIDEAIGESSKLLKALYESANNPNVAGIVVRVDSPGGSVGPSQELYAAIKKLKTKKKIVVSMGSVAASGGLYLALAADKIFCQPGTLTGSIGVIMQTPNFSAIADKIGFKMVTVKSGKLKDVGNPFRPMEAADQEFLSSVIKTTYDQFVDAVWEGRGKVFQERGISREKMLGFADGRIIPGTTAKEVGLVDEFGDLYDAARAVLELAGKPIPEDQLPHMTFPGRKLMRFQELFEASSKMVHSFQDRVVSGGTEVTYRAPLL